MIWLLEVDGDIIKCDVLDECRPDDAPMTEIEWLQQLPDANNPC